MARLLSMTGFGKSIAQLEGKKITVEVKSLNSKQLDMNLRMPQLFREKESEIRNLVAKSCNRGKVDFNLYCEVTGLEMAPQINATLVGGYVKQLKTIAQAEGIDGDVLSAVMRMPDVMKPAQEEISADEWAEIRSVITEALQRLEEFRLDEGEKLKEDLVMRLENIESMLNEIPPLEEERMNMVREKLSRSLQELKEKVDENRYEQELIYYLEKLDVTEEKVRLKTHLDYFHELLNEGGANGKKLGFLSQEIGREINTLGSKANHAKMQKVVVNMKDELEKIKEQVLNVL